MSRARMAFAGVVTAFCLGVGTGCAYSPQAHPACANAVLDDWTGGTLDATYSPQCYEAAVDALPEDLRAYTSAADDISRVAADASRSQGKTRQLTAAAVADQGETVRAFPTLVVVLAALGSLIVASGVTASLVRRRRAR